MERNPYVSALSLLSMSFCKILPRAPPAFGGKEFFLEADGHRRF